MNHIIDQLAQQLGEHCLNRGLLLATAESCTGGGIGEAITRIAGSSVWFDCAFVTYSYEAKSAMLGVSSDTLTQHGAVSEQTVCAMVNGALEHSRADRAVAVTGIAGPGGGLPDKPVGTVWFAWGNRGHDPVCQRVQFAGDRVAVRQQTIIHALKGLMDA